MKAVRVTQIVVSLATLAFVLYRVPIGQLERALARSQPEWLLVAFIFALVMLSVRWLKWHLLLRTQAPRVPAELSARSLFGGFSLSVMTPGRLGELARCVFIPREQRAAALMLNCIDRTLDFWALSTVALLSLFFHSSLRVALSGAAFWFFTLPFIIELPAVLTWLASMPLIPDRLRTALSTALGSKVRISRFAILSLLTTFLDLMTFYGIMQAFGKVNFVLAATGFPWILLASGVPLSVAGWGLREGTAMAVLGRHGIAGPVAVNSAVLLFVASSMLPAVIGAILLLRNSLLTGARAPSAKELETIFHDRGKAPERLAHPDKP